MAKRRDYRETKFDLVVFGEFFSDMIFYHLPSRPRFGEESKTDSFLVAPGGGLSTTAIAASRLGTVTGIITRVGADAENLPTWNQIAQEKLDISRMRVSKRSTDRVDSMHRLQDRSDDGDERADQSPPRRLT